MPLHRTNPITTSPMAYSYGPVSSSLWDPAQTAYNGCVWSFATNAWVPYGGVSPTLKKSRSKSLSSYSSYGSSSASYASSYSAPVRRERKTASSPRKNVLPEKKTSRSSRGRSTSRMERGARSRSRGNREPERITRERSAESRCRFRSIKLTPAPRQRRLTRAVSTSRERSLKKCSSREQPSTTCRSWADRFAEDDAKKKSWNGPEETRYQRSSWTWCTRAQRKRPRGGWRVQAKRASWLQKTPHDDSITPLPSVMAAQKIVDSSLDDVVDEKHRHRSRSISSDSSV